MSAVDRECTKGGGGVQYSCRSWVWEGVSDAQKLGHLVITGKHWGASPRSPSIPPPKRYCKFFDCSDE